MKRFVWGLLLLTVVLTSTVRGDFVEYRLPGTRVAIMLQGKVTTNRGGSKTVTLRHPKFGNLILGLNDILKKYEVASPLQLFRRKLEKAVSKKDAQLTMEAGRWALEHGLLPQFYEAVGKALEFDSEYGDALRVIELKKIIDQPLGDSSAQESQLRSVVRKRGMKIRQSEHFILLHDTPDKSTTKGRKPRSEERLDLLEKVYESFLMKFHSQGVDLEVPSERLMVVLFNDQRDYLSHAKRISPGLASTAGFWDGSSNISSFYDHGTSEQFKEIKKLADLMEESKKEALRRRSPNTKHIVRMANTFLLLIEIEQENSDIEVVSHEATHQMAGNTGLLPRHVMIPAWVHEGLATYFESPNDASWSGMGAVNPQRLEWYRALQRDREHSNIDFIVGDQIFNFAQSNGAALHGYGQAWALTHFLMESHFEKLMTYYRRVGEMPPDITLNAELLNKLFSEVFGSDRRELDAEWRGYMDSLRTDMERILEDR